MSKRDLHAKPSAPSARNRRSRATQSSTTVRRTERDRFLTEIARAARDRDGADTLAAAEEALPLDNESLAIGEGVREPSTKYGAAKEESHPQEQ